VQRTRCTLYAGISIQNVSALNSGGSRTETVVGRHSASVVSATTEIPMNRSFKPTSARLRSVFAAAAVLIVLVIAGGIEGLIDHYRAESQLANFHPSRLVQR
jgi:hypothetical protein